MKNRREKLIKISKNFIEEARMNNRSVRDISFGELLVQELTDDESWGIEGNNQARRLYHILHFIVFSDSFAA